MSRPYPVHLSLEGRTVLAVGAGRVAARRLARLLAAGAHVRVVAPEARDAIRSWAAAGALDWAAREFAPTDVEGAQLVFVATDDPALNARVARLARAAGAWVNRADAPEDCDFIVPGLAQHDECTASVSTHGRAPAASRRLARELSSWLASGPAGFVGAVASARERLHAGGARDAQARLRHLADGPLWDACVRGDEVAIHAAVQDALGDTPA